MTYGIARETGLTGARQIADALYAVAKSIDRLATAVTNQSKTPPTPIGLVIRTEDPK